MLRESIYVNSEWFLRHGSSVVPTQSMATTDRRRDRILCGVGAVRFLEKNTPVITRH
jgi:hypothetical protein